MIVGPPLLNLPNKKTHWKTPGFTGHQPQPTNPTPEKTPKNSASSALAHLFKFFGELGVLLEAERPNLGSCEAWFSWLFLACLRMPGWLGCLETEKKQCIDRGNMKTQAFCWNPHPRFCYGKCFNIWSGWIFQMFFLVYQKGCLLLTWHMKRSSSKVFTVRRSHWLSYDPQVYPPCN